MEFALRRDVGRRRQLDVQRAQQAGLAYLGGRVGRQVDVAVEPHRHQRVPALALDLGDVADRHVTDADPGILLDVGDVGQLGLDLVGAGAAPLGPGKRQRVHASPAAAGCDGHGKSATTPAAARCQWVRIMIHLRARTMIPDSPWSGFVAIDSGGSAGAGLGGRGRRRTRFGRRRRAAAGVRPAEGACGGT